MMTRFILTRGALLLCSLLVACDSTPVTPSFNFSGRWRGVADPGAFYTQSLALKLVTQGSALTGTFEITSYVGGTEKYQGTLSGSVQADTLQFKGVITTVPTGISFVEGCTFQAKGFGEPRTDTMQLKVVFDATTCPLPNGYLPPNWAAAFLIRD